MATTQMSILAALRLPSTSELRPSDAIDVDLRWLRPLHGKSDCNGCRAEYAEQTI